MGPKNSQFIIESNNNYDETSRCLTCFNDSISISVLLDGFTTSIDALQQRHLNEQLGMPKYLGSGVLWCRVACRRFPSAERLAAQLHAARHAAGARAHALAARQQRGQHPGDGGVAGRRARALRAAAPAAPAAHASARAGAPRVGRAPQLISDSRARAPSSAPGRSRSERSQ